MKTLLTLLLAMAATAAHASAPPYFGTTMSTQTGTATQYLSGNFCVAASSLTAGTCAAQVDGRNATITATTFAGALSGNAATVTTNANLTGDVTSVGNATTAAATQANIATLSKAGGVSVTGGGGLGVTYGVTAGSATVSGPLDVGTGVGMDGYTMDVFGPLALTPGGYGVGQSTFSIGAQQIGSHTITLDATSAGSPGQIRVSSARVSIGGSGTGAFPGSSQFLVNGGETTDTIAASTLTITGTGPSCFNAGGFIIDCANKSLTGVAGSSVTLTGAGGLSVTYGVTAGSVTLGGNTPDTGSLLDVKQGASGAVKGSNLGLRLEIPNQNGGMAIANGAGGVSGYYFENPTAAYDGGIEIGTNRTVSMKVGGVNVVNILSGGNVGIGTNSPQYILQAANATNPTVSATTAGNTATAKITNIGWNTSLAVGELYAYDFAAGGAPLVINRLGGNVGIGTSVPATTLDVNGSAQFGSGATKSTFTAAGQLTLSGGASVGGVLFSLSASSATPAATSENVLADYPMPAGVISAAGKCVVVHLSGTTAVNGNTKTLRVKFNGTTYETFALAGSGGLWTYDAEMCRTTATGLIGWQRTFESPTWNGGALADTQTWANALTIEVTGQSSAASANDISLYAGSSVSVR